MSEPTLTERVQAVLDAHTTHRQIDDGRPSSNGIVGVSVHEIDDEDDLVRALVTLIEDHEDDIRADERSNWA